MSEISGANVGWLGFGGISGGTLGMPGLFGTPTGEETKKESTMKRKDAEAENAGQPAAVWPNKVPRRIEPVSVASSSAARPPAAPPMPEERRADSVFQSYLTWAAANNEPLVTIQKFGLGQWWWSLSRSILGIRSMPCAPEK